MDPETVSRDPGDHLPIVIVYDNGTPETDMIYSQVSQALDRAKVECTLLEGQTSSPSKERKRESISGEGLKEHSPVEFSVVIPIFNEAGNIDDLYQRLIEVMTDLDESFEVIFVDDGSWDESLKMLDDLHTSDPRVRVVSLARNFGHQQAISAGLDYACGQAVIVMDGDLQDPPEVIPQFIDKWREDYQVVYAVREKRKENLVKRSLYHLFYRILQSISNVDIPLDAGDFCLVDRRVVDVITSFPERNRFVRGLRSWTGFRQIGLAYERDARFAGKTKYSFRKLFSLALDGMISFSYLPLRLATMLGFTISGLSFVAAIYYVYKKLTVGLQPPGFATLTVLLLFLGGVQLITVGVIGEYIGHILVEVKGRPAYIVRQVLDDQQLSES